MKKQIACLVFVSVTNIGWSQPRVASPATQFYTTIPLPDPATPGSDDEKDPAYKLYKEGYAMILDDKWSDAMKKLADVKSKFPKSEYVDDAAYWSAYAQKQLDPKKGIAAFESFLAEYPNSSYYDDALAEATEAFTISVSGNTDNLKVKRTPRAYSYSYGATARASEQAMREAERAMRDANREMRRAGARLSTTPRPPVVWSIGEDDHEKKLDAKTRLKLAALRALGDDENDKEAFQTLKEVSLDKTQPAILRRTAVESLQDFTKFDAVTVLLDVARLDTDEGVRLAAISSLGDVSRDKNKTIDNLILLWNGTPKGREKQFETLLYVIADVGNEKAVDFLVKVAQTNENDDLRSDAVYYLGNIGSPKSRAALIQILKGK
jgi:HEAT repeat protein